MSIDDIKQAVNNDNNLPDSVKKTAKDDLNRWLAKIGELYQLNPSMEICSVGLFGYHSAVRDFIAITNIFKLHTLLDVKLYATQYDDKYMIYGNALGYKFMELVSKHVYDQIYKSITDTVDEFDVFHPYH